jgi:formate C-acetyltransferase
MIMENLTNEIIGSKELTARMQQFKDRLINTDAKICVERAVITTDVYRDNADQPLAIRRAKMLAEVLKNMSTFIEYETLLAGNQASENRAAPIFPEYAMDWVVDELDEYEKRDGDRFYITEENKQVLRAIYPFWQHNTLKDRGLNAMPKDSKKLYDLGIIKAEGNITSGDAHIAVNYANIINLGLKHYEERTRAALSSLDLSTMENLHKSYFYDAILIVIDAVKEFAARYSTLATELAEQETDEKRKRELLLMAETCKKVPYNKAETFLEAVQSVWFIHLILQIESNGHSLSYGRMDQYLQPFLQKDLQNGTITEDEALEVMTNLWLKTFTINKIRSWSHTRFSAGSPLYQNVTVGGQKLVDGEAQDAVNDMSYLIMQSVALTRLPQPNLTVRYHSKLDERFMRTAISVVRLGFGMPAFNNDEIIIPSFINKGVAKEDAYNYSAIGCVEVAVPGKWGYRCTGMSFLNFPKTLLIALNNGVDLESGEQVATPTKHFKDMQSFDDVMLAWDKTIAEFTRHSIIIDTACDLALEADTADILCSALVDDCIDRGLNLKEGGAVYDFISDLQVGIANLADSLAAIKTKVFDDKEITQDALWDAILTNYSGADAEKIRDILISAPKYGNDDDSVDLLVRRAYKTYLDELSKYHNTRFGRGPIGGVYYGGTSSISANVPQGAGTLATPDGRKAHEPLAEGCSPSHGADVNGPTAVLKSVSKLETERITGGVLLNQKTTPQILAKPENQAKLVMLLRAFFNQLHGFHIQYNVVDRETMLDAQIHPEKHKNLVVRVAGYSAFFNALSKETQDDIIARTEQSV